MGRVCSKEFGCGTCYTLTCCGSPMGGNVEVIKELQDAKEEIIKVYQDVRM